MNIIDKMEQEALTFMHQRKKIEDKLSDEMARVTERMLREIFLVIRAQEALNISLIYYFLDNEIQPIINEYMAELENIMDSAIRDDYEVGIENGQRLLSLSNTSFTPQDNEIRDSSYEEVLIALLMYGTNVISSLGADLRNNLNKDLTSIYIAGKNISDREAEKEVDSNNDTTISTVIKGTILAKYINSTFKNITTRANLIARNESNRALNHGHMMRYLIAKRDDLRGLMVKWIEVRDERVCKYCRAAAHGGEYANGVYPIDDVTPPPLHSRCRCILIPFYAKWYDTNY